MVKSIEKEEENNRYCRLQKTQSSCLYAAFPIEVHVMNNGTYARFDHGIMYLLHNLMLRICKDYLLCSNHMFSFNLEAIFLAVNRIFCGAAFSMACNNPISSLIV